MKRHFMTLEYEYYGKYDEKASGDVNLEGQIRDFLFSMELMFDYVESTKPEIMDAFLEKIERKYRNELENTSFVLENVGFDRIAEDQTLLESYPHFKDLGLRIIMKYIPLRESYVLSEEAERIRWIDYCRAKYRLLYHRITTLVEILGKEPGIEYYKDFVQYWGAELAKKGKSSVKYEDARENYVKAWKEGNAMEFGVVDMYDAAFLAKFDRCVSHESMKDVDDQELAYYAVCYPGPRLGEHIHENVSMRRSVTLFSGDFCDELRWDRHVHDEPDQPSHEFSRRLVPK
ncbi:MAG: L-2-amino-thiazoline-4-carboxylic acid hydrolase [Candidatus Thorarchaeota archaeon]|nr:MAG: L-2-amino-thiazoline-4-carboxylic acid hydrolase [Candidatus Thorarchaeota archaeon]